MTNIVLYVNGVQRPAEPLTMGCSSLFGTTRAYETFSSTGKNHDRAHMITLKMFIRVSTCWGSTSHLTERLAKNI